MIMHCGEPDGETHRCTGVLIVPLPWFHRCYRWYRFGSVSLLPWRWFGNPDPMAGWVDG